MVWCDNLFSQQYPLSNTIKGNFKETAGILNAALTAESCFYLLSQTVNVKVMSQISEYTGKD